MTEQQNNKRNFDQYNNYYPTFDDPLNITTIDNVTRHQENVQSTSHSSSTHTTSTTENHNNSHNYNSHFIEQTTTTSQNSNNNHVTHTKRAPIKKTKEIIINNKTGQ
jgi:hypothetical protein